MDSDAFICQLANFISGITAHTPSLVAELELFIAILLLIVSGFVSASETAFFSLSSSELNVIAQRNHSSDRKISSLLEKSDRLLATIIVTNLFVNVAIIMLFNAFFLSVFDFGEYKIIGIIFLTVVIATILLLFSEMLPKIYSSQRSLSFCRFGAPIIKILEFVFLPLVLVMARSTTFANRHMARKGYNISVDELSHALELTDEEELSDEKQILEGIIRFGGETAKEVMTSRLDMVDLNIKATYKEVLQCIIDNAYSRIPVYSGSRDDIKGILYIKDLLPHLNKSDNFRWQSLIRPAYFVPETKMIDDLLRDFQANKIHIAIVVDEFGGTSGIITMEDIIEEIVGEIHDEYDEEERNFVKLDNHSYIFEAKTLLTDFYKITDLENDIFEEIAGEADTLAGLLLEIKGEFPALHEVLHYKEYDFEVLKMDERRILKVKFSINDNEREN